MAPSLLFVDGAVADDSGPQPTQPPWCMQALLLFYLFVFGLWLYHVYLALTNQTTYEASFRDRVPYLKDLPEHHLPFSSSVSMNLRQFCMPDPETVYTIKIGR